MARISQFPQNKQNPDTKAPDGLYSLFILKESGCPFYYRIFTADENHPDPAILGGFFIALSLFAQEVTDGRLEMVITEPCRYTFHPIRNGLLVISSSKTSNPLFIESIAKRIAKLFLTKYSDRLMKPQPASICAPDLNVQIEQIFGEISVEVPMSAR